MRVRTGGRDPVSDATRSGLWTDTSYLRESQYRDGGNLAERQAIYSCRRPPLDLTAVVLDLACFAGDEVVVDVGCGNWRYLRALEDRHHRGLTVGVDFSTGMLTASRVLIPTAPFLCADVTSLPLRGGVADVVIAAHMLYHVADPLHALEDLERIMRRGARLVVVLNGRDHLAEMRLARQAVSAKHHLPYPEAASHRLDLDAGEELLRSRFPHVSRSDFQADLVVEEPDLVALYVASSIDTRIVGDPHSYLRGVTDVLFANGAARIRTHAGCLVAERRH